MTIVNLSPKDLFCRCGKELLSMIPQGSPNLTKSLFVKIKGRYFVQAVVYSQKSYNYGYMDLSAPFEFSDNPIIKFSKCKTCKYGLRNVLGLCKVKYEYEKVKNT